MKVVLTIAGSDSGGGAGIQADLKTFEAHGVYGATVVTALTAQNTLGVQATVPTSTDMVTRQLESVLYDFPVAGVKIGMLATTANAEAIAAFLDNLPRTVPVVLDPVIRSSSGTPLLEEEGVSVLVTRLIPRATLVTPNRAEAVLLVGGSAEDATDPENLARRLRDIGAPSVLVTGGDSPTNGLVLDLLLSESTSYAFTNPYLTTRATHGTGCTLSSAICANLVLGYTIVESVARGRDYTFTAIRRAPGLGRGKGPLMHRSGGYD